MGLAGFVAGDGREYGAYRLAGLLGELGRVQDAVATLWLTARIGPSVRFPDLLRVDLAANEVAGVLPG